MRIILIDLLARGIRIIDMEGEYVSHPDFYAISKTLPQGAFSEYDMEAIYPALKAMKSQDIYLEIGVRNGCSLAFARTVSKGWVYGIDVNHEIDLGWFADKEKWNFIYRESNEAVKDWALPIDVLFIDGDHSAKGVQDDWDNFSPFVRSGGVVYFHDADATSPPVRKLFDAIGRGWKQKIVWKDKMDGRQTSMCSVVKR